MNRFELTLIFKPNLSIEEIEKIMKDIESKIVKNQGKIISNNTWGIREFAQPIKKQKSGYYYFLQFDLIPSKVKELKQFYLYNRDILRYLLINLTKEKTYFKQLKINERKEQEQKKLEREREFAKAEKFNMEEFYVRKSASGEKNILQNKVGSDKKEEKALSQEPQEAKEPISSVNKVVNDEKSEKELSQEPPEKKEPISPVNKIVNDEKSEKELSQEPPEAKEPISSVNKAVDNEKEEKEGSQEAHLIDKKEDSIKEK